MVESIANSLIGLVVLAYPNYHGSILTEVLYSRETLYPECCKKAVFSDLTAIMYLYTLPYWRDYALGMVSSL